MKIEKYQVRTIMESENPKVLPVMFEELLNNMLFNGYILDSFVRSRVTITAVFFKTKQSAIEFRP